MKKLVVGLIVMVLSAMPAAAHDPFIEEHDWSFDEPYQTADPSISYALYGYLDEDDVDVFRLDFDEADALLRVEVLATVCGEHYLDFYPQFVILADSAVVNEPVEVELPFDLPDELSVWYATFQEEFDSKSTDARPTFVEPFGGTEFYEGPKIDLKVPAAGSYWVVVFNANDKTGDYTLATGYRETFNSPFDQMIKNVRQIQSGEWLHRRCDLAPDDPNAVIEHEHSDR